MTRSILRRGHVPAIVVLLVAGGVTLVGQRGARTSVHRGSGGASASRSVGSANVSRNVSNVNVNRNVTNVNVNRDVDVDGGRYGGWGDACCYHPAARAAAVTAAAVTTAAVVGSTVHTLPPACSAVNVGGVAYQQCGSTWYQPQFAGTTVNYVVVNPPR